MTRIRLTPDWHAKRRAKDLADQELAMGRPRPQRCEACGGEPDGRWKVLFFDHDHETGKPRGWICKGCNLSIGLLDDSIDRIEKLSAYLRRVS
jgi:hypothetical protein